MGNKILYPSDFKALKGKKTLSLLTVYDYSMATILNETELDGVLVGDSLGNVIQGYQDTLNVSIDDIIYHTKSVARGYNGLIISDIPFMLHLNKYEFYKGVEKLFQAGAKAVKLEGASTKTQKTIKTLINNGLPVMGHIGLTPQFYISFGGFKYQGKTQDSRARLIEEAKILQDLGVFAIVLECIPQDLAKEITEILDIPTIGIGSGLFTDGQILVINDLLNFGVYNKPSFVKPLADLNNVIKTAVNKYIEDNAKQN